MIFLLTLSARVGPFYRQILVELDGWICSRRARGSAATGGVISLYQGCPIWPPAEFPQFLWRAGAYNPLTGTFFTPVGEMRLALHELYEVSGLVIGDAPHEEYVPTSEELHLLKKEDPQEYETYWGVLCHFHICGQISFWRNRGVKQMSWASYLFNGTNEKDSPVTNLAPCTDEEIAERINAFISSYTTELNEDTFKPDTIFESFHD